MTINVSTHSDISQSYLTGCLINVCLDMDFLKAYRNKVDNEENNETDVVSIMNLTRKSKMETIRGVN